MITTTTTRTMSTETQRVVVIQDATKEFSTRAIKRVLQGLSLKPEDELTIVAILHQFNNPSMLSCIGAGKLLGYRIKVDSVSMFGTNKKIIEEERSRREKDYQKNVEITEVTELCEEKKIKFDIKVLAGSSSKIVALEAIIRLKATWVILDRDMKKDKKIFMEELSCVVSRIRRNDSIEALAGPNTILERSSKQPTESSSTTRSSNVKYDEMIPGGSPEEKRPIRKGTPRPHRKNIASNNQKRPVTMASSSSVRDIKGQLQEEEITNTMNTEQEMAEDKSTKEAYNAGSPDEQKQNINNNYWIEELYSDMELRNSVCSICKNRRPKIGWKRDFTYLDLHVSTEGFSPKNFLSEGGFGSVYRGEIKGIKIAVKQHKSASSQGEKEFKAEVNVLSKARHDNLVMLLGSCSEGKNRLLVYEYVCNGSLDQHLSKYTRKPLSWRMRMKIALGAAKGLQYLHQNKIIHRDIRPNNILVTHDHECLLGDFGLARAQNEDPDHSSETKVVGTLGYLAPEYAESGRVSTKTDVYAYGVILLQLITGLRTTDKSLGGKSLVGWARPLLKERNYPDLIDPRIVDSHDVHQLFWMVRVAEKCLSKEPRKRLSMDKVVDALSYLIDSNTACIIKGFSPAHSDSAGSTPESVEALGDALESTTIDMNRLGAALFLSPSTQSTTPERSGMLTLSEESTSDSGKEHFI